MLFFFFLNIRFIARHNWLFKDLVNDLNFGRITCRESWVEIYWLLPRSRLFNSLFICLDSFKFIVFLFIFFVKIINFFDSILSLLSSRFLNCDNLLLILVMDHERKLITCNWSNNICRQAMDKRCSLKFFLQDFWWLLNLSKLGDQIFSRYLNSLGHFYLNRLVFLKMIIFVSNII